MPKGRPLGEDTKFKITALFQSGKNPDEIAKQLGISAFTVQNVVRSAMAAETNRGGEGGHGTDSDAAEALNQALSAGIEQDQDPAAIAATANCSEASVYEWAGEHGFEWDYQEHRWLRPSPPLADGEPGRTIVLMQASIERLIGRVYELQAQIADLRQPRPADDHRTLARKVLELANRAHEVSNSGHTMSLAWDLRRWATFELTGVDPDNDQPF